MNAPRLRAIEATDCERLCELLHELAVSTGLPGQVISKASQLQQAAFSDKPLIYGAVAELDDDIVGFVLYHPLYSSWRGEAGVYILDLWVSEQTRKLGLGRLLLAHAANSARESWHAGFIKLDVAAGNDAAAAFYKRLGFHLDDSYATMVLSAAKVQALVCAR